MKKFLRLWGLSCLIMTLTHFLGIVILLGSFDLTIIAGSYILALLFSIIPTAIYSVIVVFGSPFIKNKNLRLGLQGLLGVMLLGFPTIMAIVNTITVLYCYHKEDAEPSKPIVVPPKKEIKIFEVFDNEIVGRPLYISPEQTMLSLLKDKGAPIAGIMYYRVEEGYEIRMTHETHRNCRVYAFIK